MNLGLLWINSESILCRPVFHSVYHYLYEMRCKIYE